MSKAFSIMYTNVGYMVQDTSSTLQPLIKTWLNDKYQDVARRADWSALIDDNYTDLTEVGVAEYTLPTDFEQEIVVIDITEGNKLKRYTEQNWWNARGEDYSSGSLTGGTADSYVILRESGKIKLDPTPDAVHTLAIPYKKVITALSGDSDTVVIKDIETILEYGATSFAHAYKKQYDKANAFNQLYEEALAKRIAQERDQINLSYQFTVAGSNIFQRSPLTGWNSYDSI